ncbi:MAG: hypothetical protein N2376_06310 [Clostridia bacterium]|nr:hypothetical protein [Clostridia bacterium]
MKETRFHELFKTLESDVQPPEGLKESLLRNILLKSRAEPLCHCAFERFVFDRPLRAACLV